VVLTLSHPIDHVRWILGEVTAVGAMTARHSGFTVDVEDVAALTLRMASGALATITLDYVERPPRHTLRITGRDGTIFWDAATGVARAQHGTSRLEQVVAPDAGFERNALFVDELRHFLACVNGTETPNCTLHDGARSVAIAEGALRAARQGCVVDV
jgi:predicted dehydrogenase